MPTQLPAFLHPKLLLRSRSGWYNELSSALEDEARRFLYNAYISSIQSDVLRFVVEPHQCCIAVDAAMKRTRGELRPQYNIASERHEHVVEQVLQSLPSRTTPRLRAAEIIFSLNQPIAERIVLFLSVRLLRSADSVTQSTSEAAHDAPNPGDESLYGSITLIFGRFFSELPSLAT